MKMTNKKLIFIGLLTGILSLISIGGISANADEVINQQLDFTQVTGKVQDVYVPNKFYLSTVKASDINANTSLSLEDYIVQGIKNFNTSIDISSYKISTSSTTIKDTLNKIQVYYPEFFYLGSSFSLNYNPSTNLYSKLKLTYDCTQEEYPTLVEIIDNKFNEIISQIDDSMSDTEKALVVHDYLCANFTYDNDYTVYDIYNFVTKNTGVCQAYMLSYSYILDKLGIESYPVLSDEINHTWNMVELDGNYYQVDVTWDDFNPELYGWVQHTNFLLTDDEISNSNHKNSWYVYEDEVSATDETFQSYKFKSLKNPYVVINYDIYCIDKGVFSEYNLNEDTTTPINDIASNEYWFNFNASTSMRYADKFSSLNPYKDVIFYNTPTEIVAMDIYGNTLDTIYTYTGENKAIFGIIIRDGKLLAQVESNMNASRDDFGTDIVDVCNVQDWYNQYKNSPTETTSDVTTVTKPTETTSDITTVTKSTETTSDITTVTKPIETISDITTITKPTETISDITTVTKPTETISDVTTVTKPTETISDVTTVTKPTETTTLNPSSSYNFDIDGNNMIDTKDLLILQDYLLHSTVNDICFDVNNDGSVNILDILMLKNKLLYAKE